MKNSVFAVLFLIIVTGSFLGGAWYTRIESGTDENAPGGRKILYYVDPMNPAHTSDKPGPAPCGMPMEPIYADDDTGGPPAFMPAGTAKITPQKQQLIGIRVEKAEVTSQEHTLRALGRVSADENRTYRLVAGDVGWVWRVLESTTDSVVQKDQLLATVYNYQFLARQQQYLYAVDFEERRQQQQAARALSASQPGARQDLGYIPDNKALTVPTMPSGLNPTGNVYYVEDQVKLAKLELYNLGAGDFQLEEIARTRRVSTEMELRSPVTGIILFRNASLMQKFDRGAELFRIADLTRVWILADIFENEAPYIRPGTMARVSLPRQGKTFEAVVTDVPPRFDKATRTLKVRLETDNPDLALRPDMFVDVEILLTFPPSLHVPVDAVLDSGLSKTVFVDLGNGFFEPRKVETGWRFGDRVEIVEGIMPGETIVVSGNFLINSESRMKLAAAGHFGAPAAATAPPVVADPGKAPATGLKSGEQDPAGSWTDPVCGMHLDEKLAKTIGLKREHEGHTYYFCSKWCLKHFDKEPGRYVKNAEKEKTSGPEQAVKQGGQAQ